MWKISCVCIFENFYTCIYIHENSYLTDLGFDSTKELGMRISRSVCIYLCSYFTRSLVYSRVRNENFYVYAYLCSYFTRSLIYSRGRNEYFYVYAYLCSYFVYAYLCSYFFLRVCISLSYAYT